MQTFYMRKALYEIQQEPAGHPMDSGLEHKNAQPARCKLEHYYAIISPICHPVNSSITIRGLYEISRA